MSGLKGVSLIYPELICGGQLLHLTSNFQATSPVDRAVAIIKNGGLLAIKAHAMKTVSVIPPLTVWTSFIATTWTLFYTVRGHVRRFDMMDLMGESRVRLFMNTTIRLYSMRSTRDNSP